MEMLQGAFVIIVILAILAGAYFAVKWALGEIGLPDPFAKIINIILVLIVLGVVLLYLIPKTMALFGVSF